MGNFENSGLNGILYAMSPCTVLYFTCKLLTNIIKELVTSYWCSQRGGAENRTVDPFTTASHVPFPTKLKELEANLESAWEHSDKSLPCLSPGSCKWLGHPSYEKGKKIHLLNLISLKDVAVKPEF